MKLLRCICWACLLFVASKGFAQDYNYVKNYFPNTSIAKYKYYIGDYDSAYRYIIKAMQNAPYVYAYDLYILAKSAKHIQDDFVAYRTLTSAIQKGAPLSMITEATDPDLKSILATPFMMDDFKFSDSVFNAKLTTVYKPLLDSVLYFYYNDGYLMGNPTNRDMVIATGAQYIDSSLTSYDQLKDKFVDYTLRNGWVSTRRCGMDMLGICAVHLDEARKEKLLPFLLEELKRGYMTPEEYAFIDERYLVDKYFKQVKDGDTCFYALIVTNCGLSQRENITRKRKAIGMTTFFEKYDYVFYQRNKRVLLPWIEDTKRKP